MSPINSVDFFEAIRCLPGLENALLFQHTRNSQASTSAYKDSTKKILPKNVTLI